MNELDFSEIQRLSEKYGKDPKSRIFVQLADLYRKNNMLDEALDVINKGLEFHPEYPVAYLILGKCYYDKRSHIQARDAFEKTIALDPQNIVALQMLAKTCEILKDEKGQINAYKSIIAIDPLDNNAKEKLTMLEALQRKEPLYTVAMAEEYEKQGSLEEALKIYENLLFTDPSDLLLNQKVAELKKIISEQKIKLEAEKIKDMQVEPVFRSDDLAPEGPEKIEIERFGIDVPAAHDTTTESEIQSLEDFLVEELEQAADKKASEPQPDTTIPLETPGHEEIPPQSEDSTELFPETDQKLPSEDMLAEPTESEAASTPEPTSFADFLKGEPPRTKEAVQPEIGTERQAPEEGIFPQEETPVEVKEPTEAMEQPSAAEEPAVSLETTTTEGYRRPTDTSLPAEEKASSETSTPGAPEVPSGAQVTEPEKPKATETEADGEKKEEAKRPKEEDFKSFQDWLSGLLK
jgi:tetratricopeptide (TPR) repeat protein